LALLEHVEQLKHAIAAFERTAAHIRERRGGAADHVMVELDERLIVTTRTLECLKRSLDLAQLELTRANNESASPFMPRPGDSLDRGGSGGRNGISPAGSPHRSAQ
jgi:hypothetical protein